MPEAPITTTGIVHDPISPTAYEVELPNGKRIAGHLPERLRPTLGVLVPGSVVALEMTPYDFEKARIAGIVPDA